MSNYRKAINGVLKNEGGYTKDVIDRGGETYCGISRKYFPRWAGWQVIDESDHFDGRLDSLVIDFYKEYFWDALRLEGVEDDFIAGMLLNIAVNQGKKSVVKKVQRILKVSVDGFIGPVTIQALNDTPRDTFVYQFILETVELYTHIINTDRGQKRFITGWLNRAIGLYHEYEHYKG